MMQSRRRLLSITRAGSLRPAPHQGKVRVTDGQCLQTDKTTNHTLFYKLNRAVQRGQLEMDS